MYVSESELTCETPTFEKHGARKAEVKVRIDTQDLTIMSVYYTYYLNTKAEKTLAFGPGLLRENAVGAVTMFYI